MKVETSQRLKQIMNERGLRQVDILNMSLPYQKSLGIKMGKSTLSQYISGKSTPDQNKLVLLAKTLNVSEAWLMGYDVSPTSEPETNPDETTIIDGKVIDLRKAAANTMLFDGKPLDQDDIDFITSVLTAHFKSKNKD
ncbi:helix-turn-helix domain-containing protein [Streptococcus pluranimalium]|uniref:helix-turn-helix domain-containing protein n=1 Tax=Streptococcus pluranimalium TaxID=82348 RepID=UPI003F69150A